MRLAITARDRGCTFPTGDRPPAWADAHHLIPFADGGPTSTDNCALLCGHHHRNFNQHGWTGQLTNGTVTWTPPPWIDPTQTPRHNPTHDPPPRM